MTIRLNAIDVEEQNYIVETDQGMPGLSAYEIWLEHGNTGTEQDFLNSLKGEDGQSIKGDDGDSAYQVALNNGFVGTETQWLTSLIGKDGEDGIGIKGDDGDSAYQVALNNGFIGTEAQWLTSLIGKDGEDGIGIKGDDGDSAYQIWLNLGNTGTEQDFIASLKGEDGESIKGDDGDSAYQVALNNGFIGTEDEWLESLVGKDGVSIKGDDGDSAYQVALNNGFIGTEAEWLTSLIGEDGQNGVGVPTGGTTGQVLSKKSNSDFDTEWISAGGGGSSNWGSIGGNIEDQTDLNTILDSKVDKEEGKGLIELRPNELNFYDENTLYTNPKISITGGDLDNYEEPALRFKNGAFNVDLISPSIAGQDSNIFIGLPKETGDLIIDAPNDNKKYSRKNQDWVEDIDSNVVPSGGTSGQVLSKKSNTDFDLEWKTSTGISEAPIDGFKYARKNGGWEAISNVTTTSFGELNIIEKSSLGIKFTVKGGVYFPNNVVTSYDKKHIVNDNLNFQNTHFKPAAMSNYYIYLRIYKLSDNLSSSMYGFSIDIIGQQAGNPPSIETPNGKLLYLVQSDVNGDITFIDMRQQNFYTYPKTKVYVFTLISGYGKYEIDYTALSYKVDPNSITNGYSRDLYNIKIDTKLIALMDSDGYKRNDIVDFITGNAGAGIWGKTHHLEYRNSGTSPKICIHQGPDIRIFDYTTGTYITPNLGAFALVVFLDIEFN